MSIKMIPASVPPIVVYAGAAGLALLIASRIKTPSGGSVAGEIGSAIGGAAAGGVIDGAVGIDRGVTGAVTGAIADAVQSAGAAIGIPRTDTPEAGVLCSIAKRDGDVLGASFHCSAPDFLKWMANGRPKN